MNLILGCFLLVITACAHTHELPEQDQAAYDLLERVGAIAQREKRLRPIGVGLRGDDGKLLIIRQMYQYRGVVDDKESMQLLIFAVNNLLEGINASQEMENYMTCWPVSLRNVELVIHFEDPEGRCLVDPLPAVVGWSNGKVYIATMETPDAMKFCSRSRMTWEEAMQLAGKSSSDS